MVVLVPPCAMAIGKVTVVCKLLGWLKVQVEVAQTMFQVVSGEPEAKVKDEPLMVAPACKDTLEILAFQVAAEVILASANVPVQPGIKVNVLAVVVDIESVILVSVVVAT